MKTEGARCLTAPFRWPSTRPSVSWWRRTGERHGAGPFLMADLPDLGVGQRVQNGATGVRMTIITGGHIHILHVSAAPTCC